MTEIEITPYEKVLCELANMSAKLNTFYDKSNYKVGVHMVFNHATGKYIIMHCFGFKETDYEYVHWINTQEELNAFTINYYKQICEELRYKHKKYETAMRLEKLNGDF